MNYIEIIGVAVSQKKKDVRIHQNVATTSLAQFQEEVPS